MEDEDPEVEAEIDDLGFESQGTANAIMDYALHTLGATHGHILVGALMVAATVARAHGMGCETFLAGADSMYKRIKVER